MADPATMAALAAILPSIIGGKQLGGQAPAPNLGQGLLGQQMSPEELMKLLTMTEQGNNFGGIGAVQNQVPELFKPKGPPFETKGPPESLKTGPEKKEGIKGFLSQFGKGIDSTLSSPSQQLGIGLLGQIDPRLSLAGLLAGGLFGGR